MIQVRALQTTGSKIFLVALTLMLLPALATAQPYTLDFTQSDDFVTPESEHDCVAVAENPIVNCSFEDGVNGWGVADLDAPFLPLDSYAGGGSVGFGFFLTAPTQGANSAVTGFDGDGGTGSTNTIALFQELTLPDGDVTLEFDYRGAWDTTFGATLDRTFTFNVEPVGGGAPLQTDLLLTALPNETITDTGLMSAELDLSSFAGDDVRLSWEWLVPETNTGPAQVELDNILITAVPNEVTIEIPTLSEVGLAIMVLMLAAASAMVLRRRRSDQV